MITGANRGIGLAIAKSFYDKGACLSLGIRNISEFDNPFEAERCLIVQVDVRSESELESYHNKTLERFKKVDILINNAGIDKPCSLLNITSTYLSEMMMVNFQSVVLLSKYVATTMISNKGGWIINLSSIAGKEGTPFHIGYTASKHAVIGFTKCAARELIKHNIIVNAVCPGLIQTDMLTNYFDEYAALTSEDKEEELKAMIARTPSGKVGRPEDVANLIIFLCSGNAQNIIGQSINTDGGFLQW